MWVLRADISWRLPFLSGGERGRLSLGIVPLAELATAGEAEAGKEPGPIVAGGKLPSSTLLVKEFPKNGHSNLLRTEIPRSRHLPR